MVVILIKIVTIMTTIINSDITYGTNYISNETLTHNNTTHNDTK